MSGELWGYLEPLNKEHARIDLNQNVITLGRSSSCNVKLHGDNPSISGRHCNIKKDITNHKNGDFIVWVEDSSSNGTWVDNFLIGKGKKHILVEGNKVHLLFKSTDDPGNITYIYRDARRKAVGPENEYYIGEVLGSGQFAVVKKCVSKTDNKNYAIKIIDKKKFALNSNTSRKNNLMDEVEILKQLNHENIIRIFNVYETDTSLYLILELVTGGELFDKIVNDSYFSEEKSRKYFVQMLKAVNYLHSEGVVHRDLKPENILLSDDSAEVLKISDFGLSRIVDDTTNMKTMCGTLQYLAPEVLNTDVNGGYGKEVDLWSLGVVLYVMASGIPPFNESQGNIIDKIKGADFEFPYDYWHDKSLELKDLISKLLCSDPSKRLSAQDALNHPWVRKGLPVVERDREGFLPPTQTNKRKRSISPNNADVKTTKKRKKEKKNSLE